MTHKRHLYLSAAAIGVAGLLAAAPAHAQTAVAIDGDDIGGVVTGPKGPEAGVWVIAETHDLPTRFARIVVTDDQGRYVVPDLPKAKYKVWVRGYGLVDSAKVDGEPGKQLNLTAVPAPNEAAAAQYYPGHLLVLDAEDSGADQFGGKSDIPEKIKQTDWLNLDEEQRLRRLPSARPACDPHDPEALRRVQVVGRGLDAARAIRAGRPADGQHHRRPARTPSPIKYFADWTDRIAKGELPHAKPTAAGRASSATSWSRPGTGPTRSNTCTT